MTSYSRATDAMRNEDKIVLPAALIDPFFQYEIAVRQDGKKNVIQMSRQARGEVYFYSTSCADYAAEAGTVYIPLGLYPSLGLDPASQIDQWVTVQLGAVPRFNPETMSVLLQPQTLEFFDSVPIEIKMECLSLAMSSLTCANKFAKMRVPCLDASYEFVISKIAEGERSHNAVYLHIPGEYTELKIELDCKIIDAIMAEREAKRLEKERKATEEAMLSALRDQEIERLEKESRKRRADEEAELVVAQRERRARRMAELYGASDEPEAEARPGPDAG